MNAPVESGATEADLERRFGGLRRLYGDADYARLRALRVAIVGVGGVGSWTAEALARCGVAALVLIDLDHVAESNIHRQVQATGRSVGQAKVLALAERIGDIHPGCVVHTVEEFVEGATPNAPGNWPGLLPIEVDAVIDACDQSSAKLALAAWALRERRLLVIAGAAGGKRLGHRVEVGDLSESTHDPLLAALRQRLRRDHAAPRKGPIGLRCVFSREAVQTPQTGQACMPDGSLNCQGYGSSVTVTAAFGLAAAGAAIEQALARQEP
jgi:tRNA A37 threonylcarbamoyladenosine dehydratase